MRTGQFPQPGGGFGPQALVRQRAGEGGAGRAGEVGLQGRRGQGAGELAPPVGVVVVGDGALGLPVGVVGELQLRGGGRGFPPGQAVVGSEQFVLQELEGPAVANDVVEGQQQFVLVLTVAHQADAQQGAGRASGQFDRGVEEAVGGAGFQVKASGGVVA